MQILVVSDTHGKARNLTEVVENHLTCECVVHLGDSQWTEAVLAATCAPLPLVAVSGNCDGGESGLFPVRVLELAGHRILLVHGHRHGARFGIEGLLSLALENRADIVLYGHTHVACERWERLPDGNMVYLCNPGSLTEPRDGKPSYGVLTLQNGAALFSIGRI